MTEIDHGAFARSNGGREASHRTARAGGALTTGGLVASLAIFLSASCCVLPMILVSAGVGGAWLALLGTFFDYRYPILAVAVLTVAAGWAVLLTRRHRLRQACGLGGCNEARTSRPAAIVLSLASLLILGAGLILVYQDTVTRWAFQNRSLWS